MKKHFSISVFLLLSFFYITDALSQDQVWNGKYNLQHITGKLFIFNLKYAGQVFLFDEYSKGTVFLESGAIYPDLLLKYYGVNDELVYFNKVNNSAISIDREILEKFIILHPETGEEMLFKKVPGYSGIFTDPSPLFAQVLHEGQLKLYVFRMNRVEGVKSEKRGNNTYYQDFYALKSRYVLIKPGFRPVFFTKINHKQLLRLFPEKAGEIKQLQKQDRLKRRIRSEPELIRLMELMEDPGGRE